MRKHLIVIDDKFLEQYKLVQEKPLGQGQFGDVYLVQKKGSSKKLAAKVTSNMEINSNKTFERLYKCEVAVLRKLKEKKNPNIMNMFGHLVLENNSYQLLEYCNQGDLYQDLQRQEGKRYSQEKAIHFMIQILLGLKSLHELKIVHRDLKLENILLHDNQVKIGDFGFSRQLEDDEEYAGTLVGTPCHSAPQILLQEQYTLKCDVYSLGTIFYQLLTGIAPYIDPKPKNIRQLIDRIKEGKLNYMDSNNKEVIVSDSVKQLINDMLQYDEDKRISMEKVWKHEVFSQKIDLQEGVLDQYSIYAYKFHDKDLGIYKKEEVKFDDQDQNDIFQQLQKDIIFSNENFVDEDISKNNKASSKLESVSYLFTQSQIISQFIEEHYFHLINCLRINIPSFYLLNKLKHKFKEILEDILNKKNMFKFGNIEKLYDHQSMNIISLLLKESIELFELHLININEDIVNYAAKNKTEEASQQIKVLEKNNFDKESQNLFFNALKTYSQFIQKKGDQEEDLNKKKILRLHQIEVLDSLGMEVFFKDRKFRFDRYEAVKANLLKGSDSDMVHFIEQKKKDLKI
ncbi:Protein kinase-like domain [Pseudocohnilembus persalinus]|uniref:Protein kinase-like domain n=1 Tax=Pseudocohnilembus persalinus TaxID=266149 RepID=A0A0V0QJI9_PSEPJ|nr:Protein kinase-like domain [Pseudocohnilembus persalinus]|eukprot:KRX02385.1 Protein kinase-like domain [Pseudocohnilembus persalinus]